MSQYIRFFSQELTQAQRQLLESQLSSLTVLKHLQAYKQLRTQEHTLKVTLKTKVDETLENLKALDKSIPTVKENKNQENQIQEQMHPSIHNSNAVNPQSKKQQPKSEVKEEKLSSIDMELESLRQRLSKLQ